ncbi:MAG: 16S rRNA (guanine(527)-N(7))-methyltransferase RsmG [Phycisphaerales bacterium]|jgi:16S rRNA (guanine527-N7)-methyltransferase|nr:16S rRNA (guanine(527)-N(7))-methyltransferase RsmG [Phycisphaerales bacterium]
MIRELWSQLGARADCPLNEDQLAKLSAYLDLLFVANQRMNLTRLTDRSAAELGHIADALTVLPFLPAGALRVVDVGAGGGVPGIPLAIARPDISVVLVEATRKKATFLSETAGELGLNNVRVIAQRAEEVAAGTMRESFDIAVARAVGELVWLAEWCVPLVKVGGSVLAMKGPRVVDEIPAATGALRLLGAGEPVVHPSNLPGDQHHVIVKIPKIRPTPARYPRHPTATKGKPLG